MVRVLVGRTQNFLSPAARGIGTRGSGACGSVTNAKIASPAARGIGTNAKVSKSRRAWYWYA